MRGHGSWNRRSSEVTPNGFFTVLKSAGWFPTFHLPGGFRYLVGESGARRALLVGAARQQAANQLTGTETAIRLRQIDEDSRGTRGLIRMASLALAGAALTFTLLWWIMHP